MMEACAELFETNDVGGPGLKIDRAGVVKVDDCDGPSTAAREAT